MDKDLIIFPILCHDLQVHMCLGRNMGTKTQASLFNFAIVPVSRRKLMDEDLKFSLQMHSRPTDRPRKRLILCYIIQAFSQKILPPSMSFEQCSYISKQRHVGFLQGLWTSQYAMLEQRRRPGRPLGKKQRALTFSHESKSQSLWSAGRFGGYRCECSLSGLFRRYFSQPTSSEILNFISG